ncbi:MAG: hypothetical protein AB1600_03300 [Bacteroidota bacterium]
MIELDLKKPPLGLVPRFLRDEERLNEIVEAVTRHLSHPAEIPVEWIAEYNEIVTRMKDTKQQ